MTDNDRIDREELSRGFDRGNYAVSYEAEDYEETKDSLNGTTGFFRIGHILGFFSSFELHEIPEEYTADVAKYRHMDRANNWGLTDDFSELTLEDLGSILDEYEGNSAIYDQTFRMQQAYGRLENIDHEIQHLTDERAKVCDALSSIEQEIVDIANRERWEV